MMAAGGTQLKKILSDNGSGLEFYVDWQNPANTKSCWTAIHQRCALSLLMRRPTDELCAAARLVSRLDSQGVRSWPAGLSPDRQSRIDGGHSINTAAGGGAYAGMNFVSIKAAVKLYQRNRPDGVFRWMAGGDR
jgi:hypothetical protein